MKSRPFNFLILLLLLLLVFLPAISFADSRLSPPDFPLLEAVKKGDVQKVKSILKETPSTFSKGDALIYAVLSKKTEVVRVLLKHGARLNEKYDEGKTALMMAVESFNKTNISSIKFLIDRGADVNAVNNKGETALILAAKRGNADIVMVLLKKGSDVSPKDKEGKSAWTYAVEGANGAVVNLLEKADAAMDYKGMEWKGYASDQKAEFIKVVETQEEWSELWKRAFDKPAPDMDFEKYAVACVFLGHSADWLYSIGFGQSFMRDNQLVIPYGLHEVMLELAGPFKAGGQYHMKVFEKKKDVKIILEEAAQSSRGRR